MVLRIHISSQSDLNSACPTLPKLTGVVQWMELTHAVRRTCLYTGNMTFDAQGNDIRALLEYIEPLMWSDVLRSWKHDEDTEIFRREYVDHGYASWEEWRQEIIQPLHLDQLNWERYRIPAPTSVVPLLRGGPFGMWRSAYYGGQDSPTFADIVANPDNDVATRDKFRDILDSSQPIRLIGLLQGGDVHIVEGMHRSIAIAYAAQTGASISVPVDLYLAESDLDRFEIIP